MGIAVLLDVQCCWSSGVLTCDVRIQGKGKTSSAHQKRGFSSSARSSQKGEEAKHTAHSYFKDVDSTEPVNPKVHQVDSSGESGAPVARANEVPATGQYSRAGPDSPEYATVSHQHSVLIVSCGSEILTLFVEEQVSKHDQPYDTPPTRGPEKDEKLRYGGVSGMDKPSKANEGPEGQNAGGRKPEGRT